MQPVLNSLSMRRMRSFPESAIYKFPDASTVTPRRSERAKTV